MTDILPAGKLPPELLSKLLSTLEHDPSVLVGPGIGRDAAAVRMRESILVLKTDPITFATDEIGWYAPNINANDIACMGATPRWMLVTALLPEGRTTPGLAERIFQDLQNASRTLGIQLVGGHTEITTGLDRPILVGVMAGEARENDLVDPRRSRPGDAVILARGIAIEGTALIAREIRGRLLGPLGAETLDRSARFLYEPGISVVRAAALLRDALGHRLHALHDPTEGGLATGLHELGQATGLGLHIQGDAIPMYPETQAICAELGLDPLGLIASGALLAVVDPAGVDEALAALRQATIQAEVIGHTVPDKAAMTLTRDGKDSGLPTFDVDEIARLFASLDA